jgi:hypothetical protein
MPPRTSFSRLDPLHPGYLIAFVALTGLWLLVWAWGTPDGPAFRAASRLAGYAAAVAMFVPYLHVARRWFRHRPWGAMNAWLRWHIAGAYLALALLLLHSRAHAHGWFTLAILALFWTVMVSGVVGFYGQKLLYRLMAFAVDREVGRERLGPEAERLGRSADALMGEYARLAEEDVRDWGGLCRALGERAAAAEPGGPAYWHVGRQLDKKGGEALQRLRANPADPAARGPLVAALNRLLEGDEFGAAPPPLAEEDVSDWPALCGSLSDPEGPARPVAEQLSAKEKDALVALAKAPTPAAKAAVLGALNRLLKQQPFQAGGRRALESLCPGGIVACPPPFDGSRSPEARWLAGLPARGAGGRLPGETMRRNRLLVQALCPGLVDRLPDTVVRLFDALARRFRCPIDAVPWGWLFSRQAVVPEVANLFQRISEVASPARGERVQELARLVKARRELEVEYWLHRLGRLWLLFHGPAALLLLALVAEHVWMSMKYGGF